MIIFTIICAVMYFISAIILFMPKFRKYPFFKPFGVYMAYQGIWTLLSYPVNQLFPTNQVMTVLNYIGSFVFCLYFLFIYFTSQKNKGNSGKKTVKAKKSTPVKEKKAEPKRRQPRYKDDSEDFDSVIASTKKKRYTEKTEEPEITSTYIDDEPVAPKKSSRFEENSKGASKYSIDDEDLLYSEFDDEDENEADELENVEITDEDLEYYDDDNTDEDTEDEEEVDLYDDFDDDMLDDEEEEEELPDDYDDDDLYVDFDDDDDDDSETLKGRRYRK